MKKDVDSEDVHEGRVFHVDSEEKSTLAIVIVCL